MLGGSRVAKDIGRQTIKRQYRQIMGNVGENHSHHCSAGGSSISTRETNTYSYYQSVWYGQNNKGNYVPETNIDRSLVQPQPKAHSCSNRYPFSAISRQQILSHLANLRGPERDSDWATVDGSAAYEIREVEVSQPDPGQAATTIYNKTFHDQNASVKLRIGLSNRNSLANNGGGLVVG